MGWARPDGNPFLPQKWHPRSCTQETQSIAFDHPGIHGRMAPTRSSAASDSHTRQSHPDQGPSFPGGWFQMEHRRNTSAGKCHISFQPIRVSIRKGLQHSQCANDVHQSSPYVDAFGPRQLFDFAGTTHIWEAFLYPPPEDAPNGGTHQSPHGRINPHMEI